MDFYKKTLKELINSKEFKRLNLTLKQNEDGEYLLMESNGNYIGKSHLDYSWNMDRHVIKYCLMNKDELKEVIIRRINKKNNENILKRKTTFKSIAKIDESKSELDEYKSKLMEGLL